MKAQNVQTNVTKRKEKLKNIKILHTYRVDKLYDLNTKDLYQKYDLF